MQLARRKYRDKYGLYLIEGDNLFFEAVKHGAGIREIFLRDDYTLQRDLQGLEPYALNEKLFNALAQTETSQGIIAVVEKNTFSEDDFLTACRGKNILVLDRVQDPGNIGAMIRTADAAGYGGVIAMKGTGDIYSPKTVRAAAGSLFRAPVLFAENAENVLSLIRKSGRKSVCACPEAETPYYDAGLSHGIALIIGNEGNGLCRQFLDGADIKAGIPMEPFAESLNAAVAAGILMYESKRIKMIQKG